MLTVFLVSLFKRTFCLFYHIRMSSKQCYKGFIIEYCVLMPKLTPFLLKFGSIIIVTGYLNVCSIHVCSIHK